MKDARLPQRARQLESQVLRQVEKLAGRSEEERPGPPSRRETSIWCGDWPSLQMRRLWEESVRVTEEELAFPAKLVQGELGEVREGGWEGVEGEHIYTVPAV